MAKELIERPIEIRSEEVNDILGKPPVWIIRNGAIVLSVIVALLLVMSWVFKYPDIISAPVVITSQNPPEPILAHTNGKIVAFYVKDGQKVRSGEYLAVLENTANLNEINNLNLLLEKAKPAGGVISSIFINQNISNIGQLQQLYLSWFTAVKNYERFTSLAFNQKKINAIQNQIGLTQDYISKLKSQTALQQEALGLAKKQYKRDSLLYLQQVISSSDFDKAENMVNGAKSQYKNAEISLSNTHMQMSQLEQQIIELSLNEEEQEKKMLNDISSSFNLLYNQFKDWELNFVLKSKINGSVSLASYWSTNQSVKAGDQVMTIIPDVLNKPIGKITLPVQGAGKVKLGQKVNIKLANYPYAEYGVLQGRVIAVSSVPNQNNYYVEIELPEGLKTTYKRELPPQQEISGTADIITEDMRLIERLLNPIKSLMKNKA